MHRHLLGIVLPLVALSAAGCNIVGPASIGSGRVAYGEVIGKTDDQQLLRAIVMNRFSERATLMAVSSVTANVSLRANAGGQIGIGPSDNYAGNLVPLSLGVAYEENPTISYVPVDAPSYARQLLSPVPVEQALLLVRSVPDKAMAITMLIERMNGLTNPMVLSPESPSPDGFARVAQIIEELSRTGAADLVTIKDGRYGILVRLDELADRALLEEMLSLLKLTDLLTPRGEITTGIAKPKDPGEAAPAPTPESSQSDKSDAPSPDESKGGGLAEAEPTVVQIPRHRTLVIPIRFSAASDNSSIAVMTRSVYDLVELASMMVDVPEEQIAAGMAFPAVQAGLAGQLVRIQRSSKPPADALVTANVHDNWYYIDTRDLRSKTFFRLLTGLWSSQIALSKSGAQLPVLTVGVSK